MIKQFVAESYPVHSHCALTCRQGTWRGKSPWSSQRSTSPKELCIKSRSEPSHSTCMGAVGVTGATLLNFTSTLVRATVHCGNICLAFGQYNFKFLAPPNLVHCYKRDGRGECRISASDDHCGDCFRDFGHRHLLCDLCHEKKVKMFIYFPLSKNTEFTHQQISIGSWLNIYPWLFCSIHHKIRAYTSYTHVPRIPSTLSPIYKQVKVGYGLFTPMLSRRHASILMLQ